VLVFYFGRLGVLVLAVIWSGGVCLCAWLLGPVVGLPKYQWIADAPWYFGSIFVVCLAFGYSRITEMFRKSGWVE
jgi:hypothetical protein